MISCEWRDLRPALEAMIDRSPVLREAEQLPRDLSDIGSAGLEALVYLAADIAPPDAGAKPAWRCSTSGQAQSRSGVRHHRPGETADHPGCGDACLKASRNHNGKTVCRP